MAELKEMAWNDEVWDALKAAVTGIPPFVRKRALMSLIRASERNARDRGAECVEGDDLVQAAEEKVPGAFLHICMETLEERGITAKVSEEQAAS